MPTKYCPHCGNVIAADAVVCPYCGRQVQEVKAAPNPNEKDKWIAFLLCFFLGQWGAHKFYEGKIGMGVLYLLTCGLCVIGVWVDLILILCKPNPYYVD